MKTLIFKRSIIALSIAFAAIQANANDVLVLDLAKSKAKVGFIADGKILKVKGENGKADGRLQIKDGSVSGKATVNLNDLTTGIDLRDEHMKEKYLEVAKYPTATLDITEAKLPAKMPAGEFSLKFKGNLTIHGVTKAVSGVAKLNRDNANLKGEIEFSTKISDYKIDLPKYSGIVINDNVKINVEFDGSLMKSAERSLASK